MQVCVRLIEDYHTSSSMQILPQKQTFSFPWRVGKARSSYTCLFTYYTVLFSNALLWPRGSVQKAVYGNTGGEWGSIIGEGGV